MRLGDTLRPRERDVQRDPAAIGMADEVHLVIHPVDERDGSRRLIRQREGVFAGPRSDAVAAKMLRSDQLVFRAERFAEPAPLCGSCA